MKYLILRRMVQFSILVLFSFGMFDFVLKGNLSSSVLFSSVPLSDPFAYIQLVLASLQVDLIALSGALIVFLFYAIFAGRAFCAWVCPVNIITDFAYYIRVKLRFNQTKIFNVHKNLRYYVMGFVLIFSFLFSYPVFEEFSYIGIIQRGLIFGGISWLFIALIIFCIDAFFSPRFICSHFCPLGAFWALSSRFSLLKIKYNLQKCTQCYKCLGVCPEKQVLWMIGKENQNVKSGECIRCGKCVDVCEDDALGFSIINLRRENEK
ncbi:menaquinol dehydrogenase NapGH, membrane component NapH [Campylobacter subantarcticus LMG 24377]|uniref:Quinol dehydrogenase ferredoxin subunit NapH n=1 Tax=Campylobacter subantarcticus TaxID=497724 RepID=A0ABW9N4X7_9BACT|nr:quinol dehydrogenase ferredoxin subunit NapH [Campylobacter subantarcticus]AJC92792.1 menaquinol dehydrogenase NapGH, membrane component NapH [Campylobacter subantarcticus LMG 24377]EAL3938216.1 quinol dehydrogenase ferredoxin subunit NapH [Campylobacter lari]MPB99142.1 quinol dehydrogenase ferredoxin subunit NapH [Campylobacter subantarcticus]